MQNGVPVPDDVALDHESLMTALHALNPTVVAELHAELTPEERLQRNEVMFFLKKAFPSEFSSIQAIETAWQCAFDSGYTVTHAIIAAHKEKGKKEEKNPAHEEKKRPREEEAQEEVEEVWDSTYHNPKMLYSAKEPWTDAYDARKFRPYKKKSFYPRNLSDVSIWRTIYSCRSMWDMEALLELKEEAGAMCCPVKDSTVPSDLDMLRYKLITTEIFE